MRLALTVALLVASLASAAEKKRPTRYSFVATAHSVEGKTADGTHSREGTAAADPAVLPLGTKVRLSGAGQYSGVYKIVDTGAKVDGRHIDIYLPSDREAKVFGKKRVQVDVISWGDPK
jgi:3D (Asp-Asp-Asp) domain-containing protein